MKREKSDQIDLPGGGYPPPNKNNNNTWFGKPEIQSSEDDVDELLAALGYKVRSSDMADVAQKLEQLEMAMVSTDDTSILTHLASDTIHYNPSDLSNYLDSMLSEINAPPPPLPPAHNTPNSYELKPIPQAVAPVHNLYGVQELSELSSPRDRKRMRTATSSTSSSTEAASSSAAPMPMVVLDTQEAGVRLVHALLACAEAVQENRWNVADPLLKHISLLAASQGGAMRKVASYFADALGRRIYRLGTQSEGLLGSAFDEMLHVHFFESCPYLKFAHFTANQAILEAFAGCRRVHVIDFGIKQGLQWPALLQALALRPGGPPSFRLTAIGPPSVDQSDSLQQVGWKLTQLADELRVQFRYRSFVASSLDDIQSYMLIDNNSGENDEDDSEVVAVNSVFELHPLLAKSGAIEKVLGMVRSLKPKIVTVVEQEAKHNSGSFVDRFTEALYYYSTMFDSLEGAPTPSTPAAAGSGDGSGAQPDQLMSEMYLGKQICNIVACEGTDRTERHETMVQWRGRMNRAGFEPVLLGSNAYKQASMLLALFAGGDGYRVEEKEGYLTLGWHTRPLIATSAWRVAAPPPP